MKSGWRFRRVYLVLMPAIAVASGVLAYYSYLTATQYSRLGEETIAQSTLLIVNEKVDQVEQALISTDNAVFGLVDLDNPDGVREHWPSVASEVSPGVNALLILDSTGNVVTYAHRGSTREKRQFLKVFLEQFVPDLELERQRIGRLKHLHQKYRNSDYLISYKAVRHKGARYYLALNHETQWIIEEQFPRLFATVEGKRLYNVVNEDNQRIYGESLNRAGDYVVGRRFPTTLYNWRLQVAPKQAPLLEAGSRTKQFNEVGLIATALIVILLGLGFILYAAEKDRRVTSLKAEFIANVSHELKTPLSVVRMFSEMLMTDRVKSEQKRKEYLDIIYRESERLTGLIENVLDFAAVERGKREYQKTEARVEDVVRRAIDTFRYRIEREGTEVTLEVAEDVPPVLMDEQAVLLAVINLLDNAVKYGTTSDPATGEPRPGSVCVRVRSLRSEVEVRVEDQGPGIAKADLKRVFERFFRSRQKTQARGSGIGLALVKQIAAAHGGRAFAENVAADAQSPVARGAVVGFTLARRGPGPARQVGPEPTQPAVS